MASDAMRRARRWRIASIIVNTVAAFNGVMALCLSRSGPGWVLLLAVPTAANIVMAAFAMSRDFPHTTEPQPTK